MKNQMRKSLLLLGLIWSVCLSFGSVPKISNVKMDQHSTSRLVTITYELEGEPGIVTLDIQTNGVSIGAENFQNLEGNFNTVVECGSYTATWRPDKSWTGFEVSNATARVCAWSKSAPPDYMAINLNMYGDIKWYTCERELPGGITNDIYRGDFIVMRRIRQPISGRYVMGSTVGEPARHWARENRHWVTLTNDYWISVFEITQKQWEKIMGTTPSGYQGEDCDFHPVETVPYKDVWGNRSSQELNPDSFVARLSSMTGFTFDVPSEIQWEYACRAGTLTGLNNGTELTEPWGLDPELNKLGRFKRNGGMRSNAEGGYEPDLRTARVGSYLPNAWGLYDMLGNVSEWCKDGWLEDITDTDEAVHNPKGPATIRGGNWTYEASNCRSADRDSWGNGGYDIVGIRPVCVFEELPSSSN